MIYSETYDELVSRTGTRRKSNSNVDGSTHRCELESAKVSVFICWKYRDRRRRKEEEIEQITDESKQIAVVSSITGTIEKGETDSMHVRW